MAFQIVEGVVYGYLKCIKELEPKLRVTGQYRRRCQFECVCGNKFICDLDAVKYGKRTSCGCKKRKWQIHGCSNRNAKKTGYGIYMGMIERCTKPSCPAYYRYGGAGITVCDEWMQSFQNFVKDMGLRPSLDLTLDRIDNTKGYYKENCRWATNTEQQNNKKSNVVIVYRGEKRNLKQWATLLGIDYKLAHQQYKRDGRSMEYIVASGIVNKLKNKRVELNV